MFHKQTSPKKHGQWSQCSTSLLGCGYSQIWWHSQLWLLLIIYALFAKLVILCVAKNSPKRGHLIPGHCVGHVSPLVMKITSWKKHRIRRLFVCSRELWFQDLESNAVCIFIPPCWSHFSKSSSAEVVLFNPPVIEAGKKMELVFLSCLKSDVQEIGSLLIDILCAWKVLHTFPLWVDFVRFIPETSCSSFNQTIGLKFSML